MTYLRPPSTNTTRHNTHQLFRRGINADDSDAVTGTRTTTFSGGKGRRTFTAHSELYQLIAKPLISMRTVGSIDVERRVKPLKDTILTKKRNRLSDTKANVLYRAHENLKHIMNAKKILGIGSSLQIKVLCCTFTNSRDFVGGLLETVDFRRTYFHVFSLLCLKCPDVNTFLPSCRYSILVKGRMIQMRYIGHAIIIGSRTTSTTLLPDVLIQHWYSGLHKPLWNICLPSAFLYMLGRVQNPQQGITSSLYSVSYSIATSQRKCKNQKENHYTGMTNLLYYCPAIPSFRGSLNHHTASHHRHMIYQHRHSTSVLQTKNQVIS
eukprot:scaffold21567_cov36-Cyclotella_meneghiniana.AAC.2